MPNCSTLLCKLTFHPRNKASEHSMSLPNYKLPLHADVLCLMHSGYQEKLVQKSFTSTSAKNKMLSGLIFLTQ